MVDDDAEKGYNPFIVNRGLSQFLDTILFANEMNRYHTLSDKEQFDFYYYALAKKKYYSKWSKDMKSKYSDAIAAYFGVSYAKTKQYEIILKEDQLEKIFNWHSSKNGGKQ